MKKSTIILIAAIYVASIVIVGVFGLQALSFSEKVYIKDITFVDHVDDDGTVHYLQIGGKEVKPKSNGKGFIVVLNLDDIKNTPLSINYNISPMDATITTVEVSDDTEGGAAAYARLEKTTLGGYLVTFTDKGQIDIRLSSVDGSKATTKLSIIAK